MRSLSHKLAGMACSALAVAAVAALPSAVPAAAQQAPRPQDDLTVSLGEGRLVRLPAPMSDLFIANPGVADVQVRSTTQLYVFGKAAGATTIYATDKAGRTVFSANVRVGTNLDSVSGMLRTAMPDAQITATPMNGLVLLTGTVASPADAEEASALAQSFVGEGTRVVSRLKTATPLQVNLQVRIAEVSRTLTKNFNTNLQSFDSTGGFQFGIGRGRNATVYAPGGGLFTGSKESSAGTTSLPTAAQNTTLGLAGRLFGLDILSALDLAENEGLVSTLANPNLTALSGETASFLAGGEFPIPVSQGLNAVTIEYKQYGVSLAFTPTVLADGRISMRVRPEVSELTSEGAVTVGGFTVPALTTRRTETTVELGSGQSFMIGGLLRNVHNNTIERTPGLGKIPVLGSLFRSTAFRKQQTELVIIVTPYLVKPVSANEIALPTDGYRSANDLQRVLLGQTASPNEGAGRPVPTMAPPRRVPPVAAPAPGAGAAPPAAPRAPTATAAPGFSF